MEEIRSEMMEENAVMDEFDDEFDDELDAKLEMYCQEEKAREEREKQCAELLEANRALNGPAEITFERVIAGLKFIMDNPDMPQVALVTGLLEIGCNFNWEEFRERFPEERETLLFPGMRWGNLACGACVVINMRDSETWRSYLHGFLFEIGNGWQIRLFVFFATIRAAFTKCFSWL